MDSLPAELKTPPLGAVALVGLPAVHAAISAHLRSELRPPLHSVSVAGTDAAAQLFPARKPKPAVDLSQAPLAGILRADWLTKHRQHRPAVAVAFFAREAAVSDATHGAVCAQLEAVRAAVRRRGASLLVVLVSEAASTTPVPEDKLSGLCRRGALDARFVVPLIVTDGAVQAAGLRRLALMLQETAAGFYRVEGARAAAKLGPRLGASEAAARAAFKAAVYAEFRQDWASALQFYRAAYAAVTDLPPASASDTRRWQRWHERASVAEWCHFKLVTLLLHTQASPADAVAQLHRHMARHRPPPAGLPPVLLPAHWGYSLRQFRVFGELLQARLPAGQPLSLLQAEQPGTYYAAAAHAGVRRRQAWAALGEAHDGALPTPPPVAPGVYVGQLRREPGGPALSDAEFAAHLAAREQPAEYFKENLELLSRAHTLLKHAHPAAGACRRVLSALLAQMAAEYLCAGDCASALRLLRSVAQVYRREGWEALLAGALERLRECAGRLSLHDEHAAWSLELGSLHAEGGAPAPERAAVLSAAVAALCARDGAEAAETRHEATLTDACVTCVGGFARASAPAGDAAPFHLALLPRTSTPLQLHAASLEVQAGEQPPYTISLAGGDAALVPGAWCMLAATVPAPPAGSVRAIAVLLHVGATATLRCPLLEAHAPADADPIPPADPRAIGAARVARLGGVVGLLSVVSTVAAPSAALAVCAPAAVLAGELVRVDVTVTALEDALHAPACQLQFGDEPPPDLFTHDDAPGAALQPLCSAQLQFPALQPRASATATAWARWRQPCATPQPVSAALSCTTARGAAVMEARASPVRVHAPFSLLPAYAGPWQQHSLLPGTAGRTVLPLRERSALCAGVRAEGDVVVTALLLEPAPGWAVRTPPAAQQTQALATGDVWTQRFELTPSLLAAESSPGVVVVHWETPVAAARGLPPAATRLQLPPVAVEEPPLSVRAHPPAVIVLGQPNTVCFRIRNRTALTQELTVAVSDAAGFVFAGERTSDVEVLPHSELVLRHTVVAHAAGWQPLPEVVVTASRYVARLTSAREAVCVRPPSRGN